MNIFLLFIFCLFIVCIHANFTIICQSPNTTMLSTMRRFTFEIDQTVNPPEFQAYICIYNATTNTSIDQINVQNNTDNVEYSNNTLIFNISESIELNTNDEIYIKFDEGVLFSNLTLNSSAQTDFDFWHLKINDIDENISAITTLGDTLMDVPNTTGSDISMSSNSIDSINITSTATTTTTSINQITENPSPTNPSPGKLMTGESPPTRSAQLGMGLGITFITILIIGEILYFKFCYTSNGRSGSYYT